MIAPLLSHTCDEPEGRIERYIYPLIFTSENIQKLWNVAHKFPTLFGREVKSVEEFYNFYIAPENANGLFWVIDDFVGVFYLTDITPTEATAHYSFFDQRHRGRKSLVKKMIKHVFDTYGFRRLNASVPLYTTKFVRHFISSIGFTMEGRKRSAAKYNGSWYDIMNYGMLRDDILKEK